jgi:hypothetical protein
VHARFDVEVVGASREQFHQAGCGVLGEQTRRGAAQRSPAGAGLPYLQDRPVPQSQQFGGPAREPQPAGGEREPVGRAGEELVAEFPAQMREVDGDGGLGYGGIGSGGLHEPRRTVAAKARNCAAVDQNLPHSPRVSIHLCRGPQISAPVHHEPWSRREP